MLTAIFNSKNYFIKIEDRTFDNVFTKLIKNIFGLKSMFLYLVSYRN